MHAMITKVLGLFLLLLFAITPMACLNINTDKDRDKDKQQVDQPRNETKVGGDNGVVVKHGGDQGTEVKVGGDKGIVVEH
jgi:hypothetical protein